MDRARMPEGWSEGINFDKLNVTHVQGVMKHIQENLVSIQF